MKIHFTLIFIYIVSCNIKQETLKPVQKSITESVYASGIRRSKNQYNVYSTVSGIVKQVLVSENDMVKIGSPLFSIANESQKLLENYLYIN